MAKRKRRSGRPGGVSHAGVTSRVSGGAPAGGVARREGPQGPEAGGSPVDVPGALEAIRRGAAARARAERAIVQAVPVARSAGASWHAIGALLGMTGEGARKRCGGQEGPPPAAL